MNTFFWRMKELPSAEAVAMLVTAGVLTVSEARYILLRETIEEKKEG